MLCSRVKDIHDELEVSVYNAVKSKGSKAELLGKIKVPLHNVCESGSEGVWLFACVPDSLLCGSRVLIQRVTRLKFVLKSAKI